MTTYSSIKLPPTPKKTNNNVDPIKKETLKGRLTSAMQKGGTVLKNSIQNPGETMKTLSKYMLQNKDDILNKFSGIAVAQALANGNVSNKEALDYLFLGFAPALDKTSLAMGYSGTSQMKEALVNGTIDVGSFISGFTKTLQGLTDFKNEMEGKESLQNSNVIELDITKSFNTQYMSETPDRRVENGKSYAEVMHNLPEIFTLECGLQDGKRYGVAEFRALLTLLRESKQVFEMTIGDDTYSNMTLLNFNPVVGSRSGLDYILELKRIPIGSIELTPITITALPPQQVEEGAGASDGSSAGANISTPNYVANPTNDKIFGDVPKNMNATPAYLIGVKGIPGFFGMNLE